MAAELPASRYAKPRRPFPFKSSPALTPRRLRFVGLFCILACLFVASRQFQLLHSLSSPDTAPTTKLAFVPGTHTHTDPGPPPRTLSSEASVNLWRRVDHDCPPETNIPDPALYGTGTERCYSIGLPNAASHPLQKGDPAAFWQMNSRAMCYMPKPVCLYGRSLQNLLTFEKRGMGTCQVVSVADGALHDARLHGLNESCAAFRMRNVARMYGQEIFYSWDRWLNYVSAPRPRKNLRHKPVAWESEFAIVVPKYEWSYNICHYNRIWNFILYIIRNLKLFVPDADEIKHIDIRFRSGYAYDQHWHKGIRNATLSFLQREVGKTISVGKLRFDYLRDFQCVRRGFWLGREGRIDAFPFFNDTPVWRPDQQLNDSHWPSIPHDALWYREAVYNATGLGTVGEYNGPGVGEFTSIPVPPRKIGVLLRSPRSKRRLTTSGQIWLGRTLEDLCAKYNMKLVHVRTSAAMSLAEQVSQVRGLGLAVGLHGANMVNTVFMPPGGALFEIFPWRYVRYYYASGGNSGLRYSFHEPEGGIDRKCSFGSKTCFMKYRESLIYLTERDRGQVRSHLEKALAYISRLHRQYPNGTIPLRKEGNIYKFDR